MRPTPTVRDRAPPVGSREGSSGDHSTLSVVPTAYSSRCRHPEKLGRAMNKKHALALVGLFVLLSIERSVGQQYPGAPQFFPPQTPTAQGLPQLARSLAAEAQQTADNVRYELTGTYTGGQAEMRANALTQAATAFQRTASFGRSPELLQSFTAVDRAYASLADVLGNSAGMTPRTTNAMERVQRLSFQIRNVIGSYGPGAPGLPPNSGPGYNARGLADATSNLQIAAEQAYRALAPDPAPAFREAQVSAQNLVDQNRFFQGMQSSTVRQEELWQMCQQLRLVAWDMCALPSRFPVDPATRGAIITAKQQLDQVCRFLGIEPNSPISDPGSPPNSGKIVRAAPPDPSLTPQPAFPVQLPQPPIGAFPPTGYRPSAEFLAILNTALNQSDVFLRTIESHVNQLAQGHQFQAEARQLRSSLLVLNQRVREGAPRREIEAALEGASPFVACDLHPHRFPCRRTWWTGDQSVSSRRDRWSGSSASCCDDLGHRPQSTTKPQENQPLGTLAMLTTLVMLLTVTGQTPGPSGPRADFKPLPEPNKVAPEFAEILDRSEKAMAALGSFSVRVHVTATLEGSGIKDRFHLDASNLGSSPRPLCRHGRLGPTRRGAGTPHAASRVRRSKAHDLLHSRPALFRI